ncbi:MAG: hypothetical protein HQ557_17965 [Bacteroidetes bacterium]|nr:hypothetical protein [Bacteroidota bacterium]
MKRNLFYGLNRIMAPNLSIDEFFCSAQALDISSSKLHNNLCSDFIANDFRCRRYKNIKLGEL